MAVGVVLAAFPTATAARPVAFRKGVAMLEAAQFLDADPGMKGTIIDRAVTELQREASPSPNGRPAGRQV